MGRGGTCLRYSRRSFYQGDFLKKGYILQTPFEKGSSLGKCGNTPQLHTEMLCELLRGMPGIVVYGLLGNDFLSEHCNMGGRQGYLMERQISLL